MYIYMHVCVRMYIYRYMYVDCIRQLRVLNLAKESISACLRETGIKKLQETKRERERGEVKCPNTQSARRVSTVFL